MFKILNTHSLLLEMIVETFCIQGEAEFKAGIIVILKTD